MGDLARIFKKMQKVTGQTGKTLNAEARSFIPSNKVAGPLMGSAQCVKEMSPERVGPGVGELTMGVKSFSTHLMSPPSAPVCPFDNSVSSQSSATNSLHDQMLESARSGRGSPLKQF